MPSHRQIEQDAAAWLARRDADTWSAHDQAALDGWLDAALAHRVAWLRLQSAWEETVRLRALAPPEPLPVASVPDLRAARFAARTGVRPRRRRFVGIGFALAACAVLALGITGQRLYTTPTPAQSFESALGQTRTLLLDDGSRATLSSDSRIAVSYSRGERHIALERGEAFFEVAHDRSRPFVVAAGSRQAVAVGTRYAVRRESDGVRVVVTEGTVRLDDPATPGAALLPAGSVAEADARGVQVRRLGVAEAERYLDWRSGLLAFRDTPLAEAATEFNRYNRQQLVVTDAGTAALSIGGQFRWDNLDGFVRLLEQGFPVCATRSPERIELHGCGRT
jgi:transmembrane sensor